MKNKRLLKIIVGIFLGIAGIIACQQDLTLIPSKAAATSISVKTEDGNGIYALGGSANILVTIAPEDADQNYTLEILSGSEFASLSKNVLTAKKDGITILKAMTADGKLSDTCAVVVSNQSQNEVPVTSIDVKTTDGNGIYTVGGSTNILVTILPDNANQSYSLSILSGSEFASLSNNVLTAKKNGITILKAITADGSHSDTCAVVIDNQPIIPSNSLTIEDTVINNTTTINSDILTIHPISFTQVYFKNNTITAGNSNKHIVLFGSEATGSSDHTMDGIIITGNKIVWTGTDLTDSNEGMLIGYSINATIEYNFIQNCPYGSPVKSNGFTFTSGGIAYNVYGPSFKLGAAAKGTNGVKFYNNTFYNNRNIGEDVIGSIYINSNNDVPEAPPSTNCQVFNNIFYTKHQVPNIFCDEGSLTGLQCDYNVYYCEDGEPVFKIAGNTITFTQWQAMGYDQHSKVINPNFTDFVKLIPSAALNYGTNLGSAWQMGLDASTQWNGSDPVLKSQGSTWQVGAYVK